jgi:hypothetical protein
MQPPTDPYLNLVQQYPHCDQYVLHLKGSCEYCDSPSCDPLHTWRVEHNMNHTGENDPNKQQCPAEARRPISQINRWQGNQIKADPFDTEELCQEEVIFSHDDPEI